MTLLALIDAGRAVLLAAGQAAVDGIAGAPVPVAGVRLLPPLRPRSIRDFVAFEAHIEGVVRAQEGLAEVPPPWYEAPAFYFTNPHACVGAYDDVAVFPGSERFDFECEVAAVLGTGGRDLTPEEAEAAIIGYTIFNDWSARDIQQREGRTASVRLREGLRRDRPVAAGVGTCKSGAGPCSGDRPGVGDLRGARRHDPNRGGAGP